jgi:hypothetical protein
MGMRTKSILTALGLGACLAQARASNLTDVIMIGPMVHFDVSGNGPSRWSFALEGSLWSGTAAYGLDAGLEFDTEGAVRVYGEGETGIGLAGAALGPVLELGPRGFAAGIQGSGWANLLCGGDYRVRFMGDGSLTRALGLYFKAPARQPHMRGHAGVEI